MSRAPDPPTGNVLPFQNRKRRRRFKSLGLSDRARSLGVPSRQLTGHWCSRCSGIWFGYLLEVECPACGNRDG